MSETLAAMDAPVRSCCATPEGENFNGSLHDIAGVSNERGERVRVDAPPRARGRRADRGSTDGLKIFESMRMAVEGARA